MAAILSSRQTFLPEGIPEVEYTRKIAMSISDILSFWSTLLLKYWRRYINFKIWPTLWPGDVIDDVMSAWNITCTTRHPQQCTCKILFVWQQSFIVKSSGQTSWQTNKHTGWKHYHLAIAGDKKRVALRSLLGKVLTVLYQWSARGIRLRQSVWRKRVY